VNYTAAANVENVTLTGTNAINATGNSLANVLVGNSGANTMQGMAGNDSYHVDSADDVVDESPTQAGGVDTVFALVNVDFTGDTVHYKGTLENITLIGSANLNATGNASANVLIGNSGGNVLSGAAGADTLDGGGLGTDQLIGGSGNDTYVVYSADTAITEISGGGSDLVQSWVSFTLPTVGADGYVENLVLLGTNTLTGTGNELGNVISGNSGDNTIDGGLGTDTFQGGSGDDTYVLDGAYALDVVTESSGGGHDRVVISMTDLPERSAMCWSGFFISTCEGRWKSFAVISLVPFAVSEIVWGSSPWRTK